VDRKALTLRPIEQRRAFEEILDQLEQAILGGELSAGDRLPPERELAARLGVSRTSVREALRVCEALGIVEVKTGTERGAMLREKPTNAFADVLRFLVALGHLSAETVLEFRLVLQVWAAGRAAGRRDEDVLDALGELVERMETGGLDRDQFRSADIDFHLALVRAGENELAALVFEAVRHSVEHIVLDMFRREANWEVLRQQLTREHRAILRAIASGDVEASRRLVEEHIRGFWAPRRNRNGA
jgi:GntR family transcriptional repressor for pyruvate dehydrogenase complex